MELKRRRIMRVVIGYVVVAFGFLEGYQLVYPTLGMPAWSYDGLVLLIVAGALLERSGGENFSEVQWLQGRFAETRARLETEDDRT